MRGYQIVTFDKRSKLSNTLLTSLAHSDDDHKGFVRRWGI
jgi:hypothetical protein